MTPVLSDRDARLRAATDFDTNLVVVAGAGTGKTSLLVERFLNLILSGRTRPEETVALTFTEKAAAEMKRRVASALEDLLQEGGREPDPHMEAGRALAWLRRQPGMTPLEIHRRAREALAGIDRAFLGTIHGWCADLLRRHPQQADLSPDFSVDEGVRQDLLFEDQWGTFLTRELGPEADRVDLWRRVLATISQDDLDAVARALAENPAACLLLADQGYRPLDPVRVFGEEVARHKTEMESLRGEVAPRLNLHGTMGFLSALCGAFLDGGCPALRDAAAARPDFFRKSPTYNAGVDATDKEAIERAARATYTLLKDLASVEENVFPDLMEALGRFAAQYRRALHDEGILGFDDLLLLARNLLRDHPDVRSREAARIRTLLVDEFQDTDPLQYEIVFLLSARGEGPIPDPYRAPLEPGRLFIVGDPQQSIYRFRGADMVAYRKARRHVLETGEELLLVSNFRSPPGVLDPLNEVFRGWIGADPDLEPAYLDLESGVEPGAGAGEVELWTVEVPSSAPAEERRRREARVLAEALVSWKREGKYDYRRVAVLFRALTDIPIYARALREAGVPFVVDGGRAFAERPEVVESLCLLRALANPADPVATLGVLRSLFGGVPDQELADFAADGSFAWNRAVPEEEAERFPRISAALTRLRELGDLRRSLPLDRWVLHVLTEGDYILLESSFLDGAQRVANVRKLAERAAGLVREQGLALEPALGVLEAEFTGERVEGESPLADENVEAVRIMSIHKAKGLQFEVVVLPDLVRGSPPPDRSTRVQRMPLGGESWLAVRIEGGPMNSAFALGKRENERHEAAERKRLFYVATTRAESRLVLLSSATTVKKGDVWLAALERGWGYAPEAEGGPLGSGGVLHVRRVSPESPEAAAGPEPDVETPFRAFQDAAERAAVPPTPRFRNPSADHHARRTEAREEEPESPPRERNLARSAGVAVHRLLEAADFARPEGIRIDVARVAAEEAAAGGLDPARVEAETTAILDGFLASSLPGRLGSVEILGREVPILYRDEAGATVSGYADLVYRHGGRVYVADYKTDELTGPLAAETYRAQLADYGTAVHRALGLDSPPVLEVLFVRDGTRIEL